MGWPAHFLVPPESAGLAGAISCSAYGEPANSGGTNPGAHLAPANSGGTRVPRELSFPPLCSSANCPAPPEFGGFGLALREKCSAPPDRAVRPDSAPAPWRPVRLRSTFIPPRRPNPPNSSGWPAKSLRIAIPLGQISGIPLVRKSRYFL